MGRIEPYLRGFIVAEPDPGVMEDLRGEVAAMKLTQAAAMPRER